MSHSTTPSKPPRTYTASPPLGAQRLTCSRCGRSYNFPAPGATIRCECGWHYINDHGHIEEEFKPRLGV